MTRVDNLNTKDSSNNSDEENSELRSKMLKNCIDKVNSKEESSPTGRDVITSCTGITHSTRKRSLPSSIPSHLSIYPNSADHDIHCHYNGQVVSDVSCSEDEESSVELPISKKKKCQGRIYGKENIIMKSNSAEDFQKPKSKKPDGPKNFRPLTKPALPLPSKDITPQKYTYKKHLSAGESYAAKTLRLKAYLACRERRNNRGIMRTSSNLPFYPPTLMNKNYPTIIRVPVLNHNVHGSDTVLDGKDLPSSCSKSSSSMAVDEWDAALTLSSCFK